MTKLIDLDATFVRHTEEGNFVEVDNIVRADGVMFDCPKCQKHSVLVWSHSVPRNITPGPGRWIMQNTNLHNLTLCPSINLTGPGCGWHGWVKNGDAV